MSLGKRNRTAGHNFEREIANIFKGIGFPHAVTSRSESRSRDDQKIDIINKDEAVNGRIPYNIQAKSVTGHVKYGKVLSEQPKVPKITNVILHRQTKKSEGGRFVETGRYAILYMEDFLEMVENLKKYEAMQTTRP